MSDLSDEYRDALIEIFNIGIGRAASALADMCQHEVVMTVPHIQLLDAGDHLPDGIQGLPERRQSVGVEMAFDGVIEARSVLIFAERGALDMVRLVTGNLQDHRALSDLEYEAISEIGNVMLNHWIGAIAELLGEEVSSGLPTILHGSSTELAADLLPVFQESVMLAQIRLGVVDTGIDGWLLVTLQSPSIHEFVERMLKAYWGVNFPGEQSAGDRAASSP